MSPVVLDHRAMLALGPGSGRDDADGYLAHSTIPRVG